VTGIYGPEGGFEAPRTVLRSTTLAISSPDLLTMQDPPRLRELARRPFRAKHPATGEGQIKIAKDRG
jgi:hypothetical protein